MEKEKRRAWARGSEGLSLDPEAETTRMSAHLTRFPTTTPLLGLTTFKSRLTTTCLRMTTRSLLPESSNLDATLKLDKEDPGIARSTEEVGALDKDCKGIRILFGHWQVIKGIHSSRIRSRD